MWCLSLMVGAAAATKCSYHTKARAAKMTPEERSESARKAAKARWDKKRREEESSG
jgi:hypothetical protein